MATLNAANYGLRYITLQLSFMFLNYGSNRSQRHMYCLKQHIPPDPYISPYRKADAGLLDPGRASCALHNDIHSSVYNQRRLAGARA